MVKQRSGAPDYSELKHETGDRLKWSTVRLSDVVENDNRLEASVYQGRHAREILDTCKYEIFPFESLASAYHRPRFKRIWVEEPGFPIYQPSQILELYPAPAGYISEGTKTDLDALRVHRGQILLTCSGTIGRCSVVTETLHDKIFSHDLIRIDCKDPIDTGYIYAFFRTETGNTLINTNNYGAVVSHIEPEHLNDLPVPDPPRMLKKRIHDMVMESYRLRDRSNELLDEAENLLVRELSLPPVGALGPESFRDDFGPKHFTVTSSELEGRLDASYHIPSAGDILECLRHRAAELTTIADDRISQEVFLPGRFKRVYVGEGQGTVFFGGRQILYLDPSVEGKYLSTKHYSEKIRNELTLKEGQILVSRSGTVGRIALVPKHWEGWTASEDLIRISPADDDIRGFLYVYLSSEYGQVLLRRFTYGSVQDHIADFHVASVQVPLLRDKNIQERINRLALEANDLRYEAYRLEQRALQMVNEYVIHV